MVLFGTEVVSGDGRLALMMGLSTLIGGAASYLIGVALKVRAERKVDKDASEQKITDHLQKLIDRLDKEKAEQAKDISGLEEQIGRLLEQVTAGRVRGARLRGHVRYLEGVLSRNKLSYEEYSEECDPGSANHKPLPEQHPNPPAAP